MRTAFNVTLALLMLTYPFIVYFGLQSFEARWVALFILSVLLVRFLLNRNGLAHLPWLKLATILGGCVLVATVVFNFHLGILLYPAAINVSMLIVFAYSLYNKPSVIETLARLKEPELDQRGVQYTEKVTKVWCAFFVVNTSISLWLTFYSSYEAWMFYNGFIAYVLIGLLMAVEWIVRMKVRSQERDRV